MVISPRTQLLMGLKLVPLSQVSGDFENPTCLFLRLQILNVFTQWLRQLPSELVTYMGSTLKCFHGLSFFHVAHRRLGHPAGVTHIPQCLRRTLYQLLQLQRPTPRPLRKPASSRCVYPFPSGHRMWPASSSTQQPITLPLSHILPPFKFVSFFLWRTLILPTMVFKLEIWNSKRPSLPSSRHFPPVFIKIISLFSSLSLSLTHTVSEMNSGSEKKTQLFFHHYLIVMEDSGHPQQRRHVSVVVKYNLTILRSLEKL